MAKIIGFMLIMLPIIAITGLMIFDTVREILAATIIGELFLLCLGIGLCLLVGGV